MFFIVFFTQILHTLCVANYKLNGVHYWFIIKIKKFWINFFKFMPLSDYEYMVDIFLAYFTMLSPFTLEKADFSMKS